MSIITATLRQKLQVVALGTLVTFAYVWSPTQLYKGIEHFLYDALISWSPPIEQESRVIIVDIDEPSLAQYGAWPWPRKLMSALVQTLTDRHKVGMLGIDIVFPEKKPDDKTLRAALDQPAIVLSQILDFSPDSTNRVGLLGDTFAHPSHALPTASGYIGNHPGLLPPGARVGHISPVLDNDGKVRRIYPLACIAEECTQALSLRMYTHLTDISHDALTLIKRHTLPALRIASVHSPTRHLPLDGQQAMMIPYRVKPAGFLTYSVAEVMNTENTLPLLENSIVILGSTALGIGDRVTTPLGKLMPGVEVHAQLLVGLLDGALIRPLQPNSLWFLGLIALINGSFLLWPFRLRNIGSGIGWPVIMLGVTAGFSYWLLLSQNIWLPLSPLPVLILSLSVLLIGHENLTLNKQMRTLGSRFSRFLPSALVGRLLQNRAVGPETALHTMTVLIVDVRGFTAASEGKTPAQIAEFAQQCFEVFSAEVERYNGTIEKYTGDGLAALWGLTTERASGVDTKKHADAPLYVQAVEKKRSTPAEHSHAPFAAQAVNAAIAMQKAVDALAPWFAEKKYPKLQLSIGINTGPMLVGVFGGKSHLAWSAQGQAFNIASRIEQLTRIVGNNLLIGESTAQLIHPKYLNLVGRYEIKGLPYLLPVYGLAAAVKSDETA